MPPPDQHPTVPREGAVTLPARPENLPINPAETALIVVDMQNAYASPGGYLDLAGFDGLQLFGIADQEHFGVGSFGHA